MLTVFIRGVILYAVVIFSARLMGKRQLGELSPGELVITILISNIATLSMEETSLPLVLALTPILTLVCIDVIISYAVLKSKKFRHLVSGQPRVIISEGKLDQQALKELRYSVADIMCSLRGLGIFDIAQVQYAVVETTGSVSVMLKAEHQPLTRQSVSKPEKSADPPKIVISDGDIHDKKAAARIGLDPKRVFICTEDSTGKINVIPKEGK